MTADMVDGMGTTGTQGVLQRCAEETLRVLRNDSEVILTVLQVFKYDPLHSWCVHPSIHPSITPSLLPPPLPTGRKY
jgi:phosphatidylinositol kinase/protein kinase (PI-3  family)